MWNGKEYPTRRSMVKGYKYTEPISFEPKYGWLASGQFPAACIRECSASGQNDDAVEYWVKKLNFSPPRDLAVKYLHEFGAWEDLEATDDKTIAQRVLWTACHDIREHGEWLGLVH